MDIGGGHLVVLAHLALLRKSSVYFFIALVGNFGEDARVFLTEKHSPDAACRVTGRVRCAVSAWTR